jgi:hypothetical protein
MEKRASKKENGFSSFSAVFLLIMMMMMMTATRITARFLSSSIETNTVCIMYNEVMSDGQIIN